MTVEEGKKELYNLRLNYLMLPPKEKDKVYDEYQKERRRLYKEIAKAMIEENNKIDKSIDEGKVK